MYIHIFECSREWHDSLPLCSVLQCMQCNAVRCGVPVYIYLYIQMQQRVVRLFYRSLSCKFFFVGLLQKVYSIGLFYRSVL